MNDLEKKNTVESSNQVSKHVLFEGNIAGSPRIMFVGNSITWHAPKEDIGWSGDWGMAASCQDNDYVHIVISEVKKKYPDAAFCIVQASIWERTYDNCDFETNFHIAKGFNPDIIICGISENILLENYRKNEFIESLRDLHMFLSGSRNPQIIQGSSFFNNEEKNEGIKEYTEKYGTEYVYLGDICANEENLAVGLFEHEGIQIHPGDKGMKHIAQRYIEVLKNYIPLD